MKRYTLKYLTQKGKQITLYNIGENVIATTIRAQQHLGSHTFVRVEQTHNYSQQEIDIRREQRVCVW